MFPWSWEVPGSCVQMCRVCQPGMGLSLPAQSMGCCSTWLFPSPNASTEFLLTPPCAQISLINTPLKPSGFCWSHSDSIWVISLFLLASPLSTEHFWTLFLHLSHFPIVPFFLLVLNFFLWDSWAFLRDSLGLFPLLCHPLFFLHLSPAWWRFFSPTSPSFFPKVPIPAAPIPPSPSLPPSGAVTVAQVCCSQFLFHFVVSLT